MCGIAGILTFGTDTPSSVEQSVRAMLLALGHRGPDGSGQWAATTAANGVVGFGHTRLAIIDLSDAGRQPMTRGEVTATFNGEIYNYRTLRDRLRDQGVTFSTASDTEVLVRAAECWGVNAVNHVDGMFAAGFWHAGEGQLHLVRDRFGIKPLYYHRGPHHLIFASEIRAILASARVRPELDPLSLWHYLGYQTAPTPSTLLAGVRLLEPGYWLIADAHGRMESRRYWSLLDAPSRTNLEDSADLTGSTVSGLLADAVTSHLVSDVPVGVFLSGGIDSGALVSTLVSAGIRPQTFTVGLAGYEHDESDDARRVAELFGTDHTEIQLQADSLLDMLPDVLSAIDHPSGDGVNTFVVSKAVRDRGIKVALSGLGGDEIFGGYPSFRRLTRALPAARHLGRSPMLVRHAAAGLLRTAGGGRVATEKAAAVLESDGSLEEMWPVTRQLFSTRDRRRLVSDRIAASAVADAYAPLLSEAYASAPHAHLWSRISYAEARGYMHDVLLRDTDQMSMAHALEVRVPFLDHRLASHVVSLPDEVKAEGDTPKALLVRSLIRPLPMDLVRKSKRGFTLPFDTWMRGALRPFCEAQLGPRGLDGRGLLKPGEGQALWSGFLSRRRGVTWSRIWALVALNAWLDRHHVSTNL